MARFFVLLPKTGDLKECKNYQTISLLSHASKVLLISLIILNRLKNKSEMELPNEQAGFRSGSRGTRDLLVNIQILIEKVNAIRIVFFYLCLWTILKRSTWSVIQNFSKFYWRWESRNISLLK